MATDLIFWYVLRGIWSSLRVQFNSSENEKTRKVNRQYRVKELRTRTPSPHTCATHYVRSNEWQPGTESCKPSLLQAGIYSTLPGARSFWKAEALLLIVQSLRGLFQTWLQRLEYPDLHPFPVYLIQIIQITTNHQEWEFWVSYS